MRAWTARAMPQHASTARGTGHQRRAARPRCARVAAEAPLTRMARTAEPLGMNAHSGRPRMLALLAAAQARKPAGLRHPAEIERRAVEEGDLDLLAEAVVAEKPAPLLNAVERRVPLHGLHDARAARIGPPMQERPRLARDSWDRGRSRTLAWQLAVVLHPQKETRPCRPRRSSFRSRLP